MKRALAVLAVLAVLGAGATALAAQGDNPYDTPEPAVTSAQLLKLPDSAGCGAIRAATVRITPPTGAILGFVRIVVDGRQAARLTGVPRAASATVRIPQSGARLSVTAETLGGQRLSATRVYADCTRPPDTGGGGGGTGGGGGEG